MTPKFDDSVDDIFKVDTEREISTVETVKFNVDKLKECRRLLETTLQYCSSPSKRKHPAAQVVAGTAPPPKHVPGSLPVVKRSKSVEVPSARKSEPSQPPTKKAKYAAEEDCLLKMFQKDLQDGLNEHIVDTDTFVDEHNVDLHSLMREDTSFCVQSAKIAKDFIPELPPQTRTQSSTYRNNSADLTVSNGMGKDPPIAARARWLRAKVKLSSVSRMWRAGRTEGKW